MMNRVLYLALGLSGVAAIASVTALVIVRDLSHEVRQIEIQSNQLQTGNASVQQTTTVAVPAPRPKVTAAISPPEMAQLIPVTDKRGKWEVTYRGGEEVINIGEFRKVNPPVDLQINDDEVVTIGEFRPVDE